VSKPLNQKYWLAFGGVFATAIFALIVIAFMAGENSCDRWNLLRVVIPVFSGIAAGAFVGAITVQGQTSQFFVAATGGFGVWLISLYAIDVVPERCKLPRVSEIKLFDVEAPVGERGRRLPKTLATLKGTIPVDDHEKFALFMGAVINNLYWGDDRKIHLKVEIAGMNGENVAWREAATYRSFDYWRGGGWESRHTASRIEAALGLGDTSRNGWYHGNFVAVWTIECRTPKELKEWDGWVRITVQDHEKKPVVARTYVPLNKPNSIAQGPLADCPSTPT
jgi:hypothetical protein